jgi:hypothetical protein
LQELLKQCSDYYCLEGVDLLEAMQMDEGDPEMDSDGVECREEQSKLNRETASQINKARELNTGMGVCENKKKPKKKEAWGPVLVERQWRPQNQGETVMQKAMNMKKKQNLEPVKGNKFFVLDVDDWCQMASDVNINIGNDNKDKSSILNTLIVADQDRFERFVAQNPESVLPVNLDVDLEVESDPLNGQVASSPVSPSDSIKETNTSELWTEVVRKGKNRSMCRTRVLMLVQLANKYPMAKVTTLSKGMSDHNPLLLDFGDNARCKNHLFRFKKWWLEMDGFDNLVKQCWGVECHLVNPIDRWQFKMRNLRNKIKGWSCNIDAEMRRTKEAMLIELDGLDKAAELQQLNAQEP